MDNNNKNSLEQLKQVNYIIKDKYTVIVADTGDISLIKKSKPQDATTNPSLLVKSSEQTEYAHLLDQAIEVNKYKINNRRLSTN
jgi:transaldolase